MTKKKERPYRAWGYPVTTAIALLGYSALNLASLYADFAQWRETGTVGPTLWALGILLASYPVYWITRKLAHHESPTP